MVRRSIRLKSAAARLAPWLVVLFALGLLLMLPIKLSVADDFETPDGVVEPRPVYVASGAEVTQRFIARGVSIVAIEVLVDRAPRPTQGEILFSLRSERGPAPVRLHERRIPAPKLRDGRFSRVAFKRIIRVKRREPLAFTLKWVAHAGTPAVMAWSTNPDWLASGYSLLRGNTPEKGNLYFRVQYQKRSGLLVAQLSNVKERIALFLGPFGRSLVLIGALLTVGALVYLVGLLTPRIPEDETPH